MTGQHSNLFQYGPTALGAKGFPELVAAQWQLNLQASATALSGTNNFFGIKAAPGESGTVKNTWEE